MTDPIIMLPVTSHHCRTTHSACDCVLKRLTKLEALADKAEWWTEHKESCARYHTMPMAGCDCGAQVVFDALAALETP